MNRTKTLCFAFFLAACTTSPAPVEPPAPPEPPVDTPPAVLKLQGTLSATRATVGQQLQLDLVVSNTGGSVARSVTPSPLVQNGGGRVRITGAPTSAAADLAAGEQLRFTVPLEVTDPGLLSLTALVEAMNGPTGETVTAELMPLELTLESPPLLVVDATQGPMSADVGQDVEIAVTVVNEGEAAARLVAAQLDPLAGSVAFDRVSGPTPVAAKLGASERQVFRFVVRPRAAGSLMVEAKAFGIDDNDAQSLSSEAVMVAGIAVEAPAHLTAELVLPDVVTAGQNVIATLVVRNDGEGVAKGVLPAPVTPVAATVSGTATATSATVPAAQDIAGGGMATFTWVYVPAGAGVLSLAAKVRGTGLNSGAVIEATAAPQTAQVLVPSALQIVELSAPGFLNPTQAFDLTVRVKNTGGAAANGVMIDPAPPTLLIGEGASVALMTSPAAQNIAAGATATFTFHYRENGTGSGSLRFTAGARGNDALSGAAVSAISTQSNLVLVRPVPALLVEAVTLPAKVSQGQGFVVDVRVKNTGGTPATNVKPTVTFVPSLGAAAIGAVVASPVTIAGGARATFLVQATENGSGPGTLRARATASGTNPSFGNTLSAAAVLSPTPATAVQVPASLQVVTFTLPAMLNRGARFSAGMVIANSGQADAKLVAAGTPVVTVTGGAVLALQTSPVSLTIPGGSSRTFTWVYNETGAAAGTVGLRVGGTGADANSNAALSVAAASSNVASIEAYMGCNGSVLRPGLDGHLLDADRVDAPAQGDRLRVKPYSSFEAEYTRAFGSLPASIRNQGATFDVAPARWAAEQELSAISLYRAFLSAYQACVTLTAGPAQYATAPTATTAASECSAWQRRFWSATPSAAQTTACATFAVSADNDGATPREKWAATCATAAASLGFLAE